MVKKRQKVVKGIPSAVVLSIVIHAALFLLAGMLVVFTVVKKEEKKFIPPKAVERPKMKLRKPKVKVKKSSKPKPTTRIVTKVNRASMPDLQLPEMSGLSDGLAGGVGGFDMMPDLSEVTVLGSGYSIGNDFIGTFYDLNRDRKGRYNSAGFAFRDPASGQSYWGLINKFMRKGWKTSTLARYYRSPRNLYTTTFVTPPIRSTIAPLAFGDTDAGGSFWVVHYKGQLVCPASHTNGITFRFWGQGDDFLMVRVDGEIVLGSAWPGDAKPFVIGHLWESDSADSLKYVMGNNRAVVGDWITLEPGDSLDMEVLIGDWGGASCYMLAIEEEGVEYERNRQGGPILPAFKTAEPSHELLDAIYTRLQVGELCMTNGPVFCDYDTSGGGAASLGAPEGEAVLPEPDVSADPEVRIWTLAGNRTMEAEFVTVIGTKAVLRNPAGKIKKILLEQFSEEDRTYIELACPPTFKVDFTRKDRQHIFSGRHPRPSENRSTYGVRFKQNSAGAYNHELQAEMFVVGQQNSRLTGQYFLLDRQQTSFAPTRENQRTHEFKSGRKVVLTGGIRQGCDYKGYLVTITDERGETITVETSHQWLADNLKNLKELKVGNYFSKEGCKRTFPTRPKKTGRY